MIARSWGAELSARVIDHERIGEIVERVAGEALVRELMPTDAAAALVLDAATADDYPGDVATQHEPLTAEQATVGGTRRAWGAFSEHDGELVAVTFVDVAHDRAETDFTVVHAGWRGRGLGTAVKAASVLDLSRAGIQRFRCGGSADNSAIMAANRLVGYEIDEHWVTLAPRGSGPA